MAGEMEVTGLASNQNEIDGGDSVTLTVTYAGTMDGFIMSGDLVVNRVYRDESGTIVDEDTLVNQRVSVANTSSKVEQYVVRYFYTGDPGGEFDQAETCAFIENISVSPAPI